MFSLVSICEEISNWEKKYNVQDILCEDLKEKQLLFLSAGGYRVCRDMYLLRLNPPTHRPCKAEVSCMGEAQGKAQGRQKRINDQIQPNKYVALRYLQNATYFLKKSLNHKV